MVTFLVSYSREIYLVLRMVLIISAWLWSLLSANTGTSSCMRLMIRMSMLLMYYFRIFEWVEELALRSLVMGWLPPSSEASILILSNLETTLSFLMNAECDCVLFLRG